MSPTKVFARIMIFVCFLSLILPTFFVNAQEMPTAEGVNLTEVDVKNLPASDLCCFSFDNYSNTGEKFNGLDVYGVQCVHRSALDFKKCTKPNGSLGDVQKCGVAQNGAFMSGVWSENNDPGEVNREFAAKIANGKCWYKSDFELQERAAMGNNNCCFCLAMTKANSQCFHQKIVGDKEACQNFCENLNSSGGSGSAWGLLAGIPGALFGAVAGSYYNWSWQKCSTPEATMRTNYDAWFGLKGREKKVSDLTGVYVPEQCWYSRNAVPIKTPPPSNPLKIQLAVPIPGLEDFSKEGGVTVTNETISIYLGALYKFLIGIAAMLAVFMIAYGGVLWLFAGGKGDTIGKAKETIIAAISGLLLALASYAILYFINPELVALKFPDVSTVPYAVEDLDAFDVVNISDDLGLIPQIVIRDSLGTQNRKLNQATIDKLMTLKNIVSRENDNAENKGKFKYVVQINSAYRTYAEQKALYDDWIKYKAWVDGGKQGTEPAVSNKNQAAEPGSGPHEKGMAVDLCLKKKDLINNKEYDSCGSLNKACNDSSVYSCYPDLQGLLQNWAKEAGFTRFCGEWWHFEAVPLSKTCEPGVY